MGDVFFVITEIGGDIPHQKIGIHAVFYIINDIQIDLLACILFNGELRMMHLVFEFTEHTGAEIVVFGRISIGADAILHLLHQNNQPLGVWEGSQRREAPGEGSLLQAPVPGRENEASKTEGKRA